VNSHEEPGRTIITKDTCKPYGKIKYPSDPKGNVIECARSSESIQIEARSIVYYALLDDGTIWAWSSSGLGKLVLAFLLNYSVHLLAYSLALCLT
jgi:hypothetical protein